VNHYLSAAAAMATPPLKSGSVFTTRIVDCTAYVALSIPRLVPVKVSECLLSMLRQRSYATVMGIIAVIDVAVEAMRPMEPWASSEE
jgi:hypothetical protein